MSLATLRAKLEALGGEISAIKSKPAGDRTPADLERIQKLPAEVAAVKASIDSESQLEGLEADLQATLKTPANASLHNSKGNPAAKAGTNVEAGKSREERLLEANGGWASMGHLAWAAVKAANHRGGTESRRLGEWQRAVSILHLGEGYFDHDEDNTDKLAAVKAASGMGVTADPTADIFVPTQFSQQIFERAQGGRVAYDLWDRVDKAPINGTTMVYGAWNDANQGETTRHGGVIVYHEGEGDTATGTTLNRPRNVEFRLKKLMAAVTVSNELLEDSPFALDAEIGKRAQAAFKFKFSQTFFEGAGAAKGLGYMNAPCKVAVAKEGGQAAATIVAANISKMWARMSPSCRANAVWMYNVACEPQFDSLYYGTGSNAGQLVFMPPGGLSESPFGRIKGRPAIASEHCAALGTEGDIVLVDWTQYRCCYRSNGVKQDVSMHLRFLQDEQVFRYTARYDSKPMWDAAITPYKGADTLSCFVSLAVRA